MRTMLFLLMLFVGSFASAQTTSHSCDEYTALRLDRIESDIVELRKLISERCPSDAKSSACTCNPCLCVNCTCKAPAAAAKSRPTITCRGTCDATADWRTHEMQALFAKGYDVNFEIDNTLPLRYAYSWKPGETRGYLASLELPDVNQATNQKVRSYESTIPLTWRAIINYGAGYRVEDENGQEVAGGLNSYYVLEAARQKATGKNVTFAYFAETVNGLEPDKPWGPPPIRDSPAPVTVIPTVTPSVIITPMSNECYIDATGKRICPSASQPVINRPSPIYSNRFFRR